MPDRIEDLFKCDYRGVLLSACDVARVLKTHVGSVGQLGIRVAKTGARRAKFYAVEDVAAFVNERGIGLRKYRQVA